MPFTPIGNGKYKSPSGRTFNQAQVKLYYANGGLFPGEQSEQDKPHKSSKTKQIAKMLMSNGR